MHVVHTCRRGLAKTFTGWQRYVRIAVEERNGLLARGMAMLTGGVRYKCFIAWRDAAVEARVERDTLLREQLLRNGSMQCVKIVRAWFEWRGRRLAAKYKIMWTISPAGCAFRAWQQLIDAKRRRDFLEWALGPDMSHLQTKLKAATRSITETMSSQIDELRESLDGVLPKVRHEATLEARKVRELLDVKMDKLSAEEQQRALLATAQEVDAMRDQLAQHAEAQRSMSIEAERGVAELSEQMGELSREVDERVAQTERSMEQRVDGEAKAIGVVSEEVRHMKSTKANHEELVKLVQKLQHRPKPGNPMGVQALLTVPYPMPPGNTRTSASRLSRQRPVSAAPAARGGGTDSVGALPPAAGAEAGPQLREVPTDLPAAADDPRTRYQPFLATSEQILVRPLPADAPQHPLQGGASGQLRSSRQPVPPSSHTAALSARASPTVNMILNRRPASARGGPAAQVGAFASRTERLERQLGGDEPRMPDMA